MSTPFPTSSSSSTGSSASGTGSSLDSSNTTGGNLRGGSDTLDRATTKAHEALDRAALRAGPAVTQLREKTASAVESLKARMQDMSAMQGQALESARTQVRANPLAAVGIAAAAGYLLGALLRRRCDPMAPVASTRAAQRKRPLPRERPFQWGARISRCSCPAARSAARAWRRQPGPCWTHV